MMTKYENNKIKQEARAVKSQTYPNMQLFIVCFVATTHSIYDNPCEFLSAFETSGTCPTQLETHGLPCTCPFNPLNIDLPPTLFEVTHLNTAWQVLATVSPGVLRKHTIVKIILLKCS